MKKILLSIVLFAGICSANAQTIEVYGYNDDGTLSSTPLLKTDKKVKVIFKATIPNYKTQVLNAGDKVEGKIIVDGDTLTKGTGGIVADYVDLGIIVDGKKILWATHNIGATNPEDYGAFIAWGENGTEEEGYVDGIKMKEGSPYYVWSNLKYCSGTTDQGPFTKYVATSDYGTVDNKNTLDSKDDAAIVNWGGKWRMPTYAEQTALRTDCTWTWYASGNTDYNGVAGYKVTGANGNSIFLPAGGFILGEGHYNASIYGYYWSNSLYTNWSYCGYAIDFNSSDYYWHDSNRFDGRSIRPVRSE